MTTECLTTRPPLVVDLDGTLVRTDTLVESIRVLLLRRPLLLLLLPIWLLGGKARLKAQVSRRVELDVAELPYNHELLAYLRAEADSGRRLILATAADQRIAERVACHLGLFSAVLATRDNRNLKGHDKVRALREAVGEGEFDYVGDSTADVAVWSVARRAVVVSSSERLLARVQRSTEVERVFPGAVLSWRGVLKAIRVHQWVKNILIFAPIVLSHTMSLLPLLQGLVAFMSFSLLASCVYLLNDLVDLEADRTHATKRHRPLASGRLPLTAVGLLLPGMLIASVALAALLPVRFGIVLVAYFVLTSSYSLSLKRIAILDVLVLALLYTIRIHAGSMATGIPVSDWLLAFSTFFFLSLACVKRYSELHALRESSRVSAAGRGYVVGDAALVEVMGVACGYLGVLVMALYVTSAQVVALYGKPQLLWLVCLLLLYWISWVWMLTHRGEMHDDPVIFAIRDRQSYVLGFVAALIIVLAS